MRLLGTSLEVLAPVAEAGLAFADKRCFTGPVASASVLSLTTGVSETLSAVKKLSSEGVCLPGAALVPSAC